MLPTMRNAYHNRNYPLHMASILKNTQEVTIFRNRETQEFSL